MVAISHEKKFIFLKTQKAAGTSVEIFLERYCLPQELRGRRSQRTAEIVSEAGIVGFRGPKHERSPDIIYYNHMPAAELKRLLPKTVWDSYLKTTCIRNPFDQMVSRFWYFASAGEMQRLRTLCLNELKHEFSSWLFSDTTFSPNHNTYCLSGVPAVDFFIRYEHLLSDLRSLCERLDIPFDKERLGRFKANIRPNRFHFRDYYGADTERLVANLCRFELDAFGYKLK